MRNYFTAAAIVIPLLLMLGGCSTTSRTTEGEERQVPQWVVSPPEDTSDVVYFTGAGSNSADNSEAARRKAVESLVSSVHSFIGVKIEEDTSGKARRALESWLSSLRETARAGSKSDEADFRIEETYSEKRGALINIYLLAKYEKNALLDKKSELKKLFEEQNNPVILQERKAKRFLEEYKPFEAASLSVEAAASAVSEGGENAEAVYRRNIEFATDALERIRLEQLSNNISGNLRQSFSTPFRLRVFIRTEEGRKGLSGVPLKVEYTDKTDSGRWRDVTASLVTNETGFAEFIRPAPGFIGTQPLRVYLDLKQLLAPLASLDKIPAGYTPELSSLRSFEERKKVVFSYTVVSRAKEIPTAVWVGEFDNGGNILSRTDASAGIVEVLENEGFDVDIIEIDAQLAELPVSRLSEEIQKEYGDTYERLVYGTVSISNFKENGQRYTVEVSGAVEAVDITSDILLYDSGSLSKSAIGQNPQSAMSAAFKQFGKQLGERLVKQLP